MTQHRDEIQSWWDSRPRHDRRGNLRAIQRKYGISHLYRYYLGSHIRSMNFSHRMTLDVVKAAIANIESEIRKEEIAAKMGFPTASNGQYVKPMTLLELIDWHINDAITKNKPRTVKNYESAFSDFMDWFGDTSIIASSIPLKKMYEYRTYLRAKGNSELTTANRIKLVRAVFSNAKRQQQIATDPFYDYRGESIPPSKERDILTAAEMRHIADMIRNDKKRHWQKVWLAWQIARFTGMRGSDILRLDFSNIDWEKKTLSFKMAKRKDLIITIPIHRSLFAILERLKERRGKIFSFEDFKWTEQILTKRFGYYIRKLKGSEFVGAGSHTPRHSLNQIMLDNDVGFEYRCFFTGHVIPGEQKKYLHQKQKSHLEKLRSIIESLPLE